MHVKKGIIAKRQEGYRVSSRETAREGKLRVHAWYYNIGAGTVYRYSPEKERFEPIGEEEK